MFFVVLFGVFVFLTFVVVFSLCFVCEFFVFALFVGLRSAKMRPNGGPRRLGTVQEAPGRSCAVQDSR